jgi:hypothetical protein
VKDSEVVDGEAVENVEIEDVAYDKEVEEISDVVVREAEELLKI